MNFQEKICKYGILHPVFWVHRYLIFEGVAENVLFQLHCYLFAYVYFTQRDSVLY